jgi:hypothetical protein
VTAATTTHNNPDLTSLAGELTILLGRFMLPDLSEHPCQVSQLSIDGAVFGASFLPPPGLTIVAYIDGIGRVEGRCEGPVGSGFAVRFSHSGSRRSRFEKRLKWLSEAKAGHPDTEQRRTTRDEPKQNVSQIALSDGRSYACEVVDISLTGAAVKTDIMPTLGTQVMLGKMRGRVVRHIEHGVAIEFVRPMDRATHAGEDV